jgi:hypothetical protein
MYVGKKPLNQIEYPVYPFIQKDPPRFYQVKKHWVAHPDDIMRDQEHNPQFAQGAVLAVSRDENKNRYGASSYTTKVNKEFRPPLIDPEYDLQPLSRLPRPRTSVRINPAPLDISQAQNTHDMDISAFIDEKKLLANVRPTFNIPYEENNLAGTPIPDLQFKMPQVEYRATLNPPINSSFLDNAECPTISLDKKNPDVYLSAGVTPLFNLDSDNPAINLELRYNNPQVSASSGVKSTFLYNQDNASEFRELNYNHPQTSLMVNKNSETTGIRQTYNPQMIKTRYPLSSKVSIPTSKESRITNNYQNENRTLRDTLKTTGLSLGSGACLPKGIEHQTPTLKTKVK